MSELDDQIQNRREKRQRLAAAGIVPYPHRFDWDLEPADVRAAHGEKTAEELEALGLRLRVPGRVVSIRRQGKLIFADVHDGKEKLQLFIRLADVPDASWNLKTQIHEMTSCFSSGVRRAVRTRSTTGSTRSSSATDSFGFRLSAIR